MLIINSILDISEFKVLFPSIVWTKLPRTLGVDHKEYFYTGLYEDDEKRVNITIRPSKIMAISENFKKRMPQDGSIPKEGYNGMLVEWGSSTEVKIDDKLIAEIDMKAGLLAPRVKQVIEW